MPRYNEFLYNSGALYGDSSKLVFNAEPMVATAIDYSSVTITYIVPSGGIEGYVGFRVVRSQDGYPETEEDGVTIYEVLGLDITPDGNPIVDNNALWIPEGGLADGATAPTLQEGQFVYYKAWILKTPADTWIPAGQCYTLVPKRHTLALGGLGVKSVLSGSTMVDQPINLGEASTTHDRFMSYIPQVFTSITNSPLDEINSDGYDPITDKTGAVGNTLLSSFLSAFSFTVDEMMTFAANSLPAKSGQITSPELLSIQSEQFNIAQDSLLVSKTQKRLVRDSIKTYALKGTLKGFKTFVENTTNYSAVITESRNKILGHENSTFDAKGWDYGADSYGYPVVDWVATSDAAQLSLDEAETIPTVDSAIDKNYCLKIITSTTNAAISYGSNSPILHGIPVVGGVQYVLSFQAKRQTSPSISGTATAVVTWYDSKEQIVATTDLPSSTVATLTTSFSRFNFSWVAPIGARYASIKITFSSAQTYYLDMVMFNEAIYSEITGASGTGTTVTYQGDNSFAVGDVVSIRGVVPSSYNLSNATITSVSSSSNGKQNGFTVTNAATGTFVSGGMVSKIEASPTYSEARSVRIFLNPSNTNYMVNPSFEGSGAGWTATNCITSAVSIGSGALYSGPIGARTSAYKLRITPTGSSAIDFHTSVGSATPGDVLPQNVNYTFSVYIRSSSSTPLTLTGGLKFGANTNLITNYSFETDTSDWYSVISTSVVSLLTGAGVSGLNALSLKTHGAAIDGIYYAPASEITVTPGFSYTFSVYASQDGGNYGSQDFQAHIDWYSATGFLSTSSGATVTPDFDGGYTVVNVAATAPAGAVSAIPSIRSTTSTHADDLFYFDNAVFNVTSVKDLVLTSDWQRVTTTIWAAESEIPTSLNVHITGVLPTGTYLEIDAAQLEVGVKPTDYFDGSMIDSGCAWVLGSANSTTSRSVKYANQSYRVARLLDTIKDFLPINTPWLLDYYDNAVSDHLHSGIS